MLDPAFLAALVGLAGTGAGARYGLRGRFPDDSEAAALVLALDHFDPARLSVDPLYVVLGRAAHRALPSSFDAACAVSAAASAATVIALGVSVRALSGSRAGLTAAALFAVAALPFLVGAAPRSEAVAMALAAIGYACWLERRSGLGGILLGLMLGARAAWLPVALSYLVVVLFEARHAGGRDEARSSSRPALTAAGGIVAGTLAWAAPWGVLVGWSRLVALERARLVGHLTQWGGSILTDPQSTHGHPRLVYRLGYFFRDLLVDGVAPDRMVLCALALLAVIGLRLGVRGGAEERRLWLGSLVLGAPYAAWAYLGQNLAQQPRHLLPLVTLSLALLAVVTAGQPFLGAAAVALVAASSLPLCIAHGRTRPAAAELADYVQGHYSPGETGLYAGRSIQLLGYLAREYPCHELPIGAQLSASPTGHAPLPPHALFASDAALDAAQRRRMRVVARACRAPEALDRETPCLTLSEYSVLEGATP